MGSLGFGSNARGVLSAAARIPARFRTWPCRFGPAAAGNSGRAVGTELFAQPIVQTRWPETYARRSHHELQQFLRVGTGKGSTKGSGQSLENAAVVARDRRIVLK